MLIALIVILGFIGIVSHYIIKFGTRGASLDLSVTESLQGVLTSKSMNTSIKQSSRLNPAYDYDKDQIEIQPGDTAQHLAQGFHELGHAIDAYNRNLIGKEYGFLSGVLFYTMKYSLPVAVFLHALMIGLDLTYLQIPTYFFIALSLIFTTVTLKEEVVASKYALQIIHQHLNVDKRVLGKVKLSLFGGFISYIVLFVMSLMLLGFQLFNDFYYY